MFSISYVVALLSGIVLLGLGWLLNHWLKGGKANEWKTKFLAAEKENKAQNKQLNKETKLTEQLRQKSESWKQEFQALTRDTQRQKKEFELQHQDQAAQIISLKSEFQALKLDKDRAVTALDKLQKEQVKLKEKYKKDLADGSDWRSERQKLERALKSTTDKLEKSNTVAEEYKGKYAEQATEINKIRVMERELRHQNTKIKKLEEDCSYWEKKHYDAHHELAQIKDKSASLVSQFKELESLRKGDEILKGNLMSQIQEFKTKFVDINNKYRDLVNNN